MEANLTHVLAVYTVIYVAILFTTVGIWAGDIAAATGDFRVLLFSLGAFSLKLAIDDYVHFSKRRERLEISLVFSLASYLLLASSIAFAALARARLAPLMFGLVFVVCTIWLLVSDTKEDGDTDGRWRRIGWLVVNMGSALLLAWAATLGVQRTYSNAVVPLMILFIVIVTDFFMFGTLKRLAEEVTSHEQQGSGTRVGS
jgi:hypothetical protein